MRKLLLTAVLAFGIATAQAQCTESELSPAAGVPHTYQVSIGNTQGYDGDGVYQWYVTKNATNLLTGEMADDSDFKASAASADLSAYNSNGTDTKNKLELTWKTEAIASGVPYFLVMKYTENNGTCDAMNMKVMKIEPLNQFKLAIVPAKDENGTVFGTGEDAVVCAANVDGATYDSGADKVTYTYGENTIYYNITASGFVGSWKPQISLPALGDAGQKYVSAQWKDTSGIWHDFTGLAQNGTTQTLISTDLAAIPAPTTGTLPQQSYPVKIVIDNERYENTTGQTLSVAIDGTYGNSDALKDKTDDCSADEGVFEDKGSFTIKARPTVTATSGQFVQEVH